MGKINPCLWFNDQAEEAAQFYKTIFKNSKVDQIAYYGEAGAKMSGQKKGSVMTVDFELDGQNILGLNGGPLFNFDPSFSFMVWCESESEIGKMWARLSDKGAIRMGLDKYPWAKKYGWTSDKYGVEWQLIFPDEKPEQKMAPAFLFVDKLFGKGQQAIDFYLSVFKDSKIDFMARDKKKGTIMHCAFSLAGERFVLMEGEGKHGHSFSPAFSLVVNCETQDEVDYYWTKLSQDGTQGQCGWLEDKFGVSWQIVPTLVQKLRNESNPNKAENVMNAIYSMKKLDIEKLQHAYRN